MIDILACLSLLGFGLLIIALFEGLYELWERTK